jgi:hypothetical protein
MGDRDRLTPCRVASIAEVDDYRDKYRLWIVAGSTVIVAGSIVWRI